MRRAIHWKLLSSQHEWGSVVSVWRMNRIVFPSTKSSAGIHTQAHLARLGCGELMKIAHFLFSGHFKSVLRDSLGQPSVSFSNRVWFFFGTSLWGARQLWWFRRKEKMRVGWWKVKRKQAGESKENCPRDLGVIYSTLRSSHTVSAQTLNWAPRSHRRILYIHSASMHYCLMDSSKTLVCKWLERQHCSACAHTATCLISTSGYTHPHRRHRPINKTNLISFIAQMKFASRCRLLCFVVLMPLAAIAG